MPTIPQTKADLEKLISDRVEESLQLDYKASEALQNTDGRKKEIAKDVSALANSAGGVVIYGMKEYDEAEKKHLPEKITPIDRSEVSKEWLEQVINSNISPKIEGLVVHPIPLDQPNEVIYVVEIPQSTTAHQNLADGRYYRRYNFQAVWMVDYEIRDILNRTKHPVIEIVFEIEKDTFEVHRNPLLPMIPLEPREKKKFKTTYTLKMTPRNVGNVLAQYINFYVTMPEDIADVKEAQHLARLEEGLIEFYGDNTYRDVVDVELNALGGSYPKYGPSRFDPVLPGLRGRPDKLLLSENPVLDEREIVWKVHADNALPRSEKVKLSEIPVLDKPKRKRII